VAVFFIVALIGVELAIIQTTNFNLFEVDIIVYNQLYIVKVSRWHGGQARSAGDRSVWAQAAVWGGDGMRDE